jgi:DNA-binding NarL/FixJ family response regulator
MSSLAHRILIVDDHKIVRQGLHLLLTGLADFVVVGETTGAQAVVKAIELQPTIILMDLQLPHSAPGLETLTRLRQSLPTTRVIVLTSSGTEGDLVYRAIRAGAMGFVLKSTGDINEVEAAIRTVAQGHVAFSPPVLMSLLETISGATVAQTVGSQAAPALSPREKDVLDHVAAGRTNRQIAERLIISESTVRTHLHNILEKLQMTNRVQVAAFALGSRSATRSPFPPRPAMEMAFS